MQCEEYPLFDEDGKEGGMMRMGARNKTVMIQKNYLCYSVQTYLKPEQVLPLRKTMSLNQDNIHNADENQVKIKRDRDVIAKQVERGSPILL